MPFLGLCHREAARRLSVRWVVAVCATVGLSHAAGAPADDPQIYAEDFEALWTYVRDNYAYFDQKRTDWDEAGRRFRPLATKVQTRREFVGVLEQLLDQLYDPHAHLGINTPTSPRLIPSGADLRAEWRDGAAIITDVRLDSDAERAGLRAGMMVRSIDGKIATDAVRARAPVALRRPDPAADDWALRATLAGRHGATVTVEAGFANGEVRTFTFTPEFRRESERLTWRTLAGSIGYIRPNNSLGETEVIAAFDGALASLRETRGLILDLRDTPSGGNTTVARGIMGRLISTERPYQRHELAAEERRFGVRRIWVEYVAPRGPFTYEQSVVVLVGRWTGSMGEGIAIGLDGMKRATVIGAPMAGLLGATYQYTLPHTGITASIPAERLYHVNGLPREKFSPEKVPNPGTSADDRVLAAALARLRGR